MVLTPEQLAFLQAHPEAAMVTVGADGRAKPARVSFAVVDGRILSSGTEARTRTKRLRRDPRCTLFVFEAGPSWLAVEADVTVIDGAVGIATNLRLFRAMQGRPTGNLSWFGQEMDEAAMTEMLERDGRIVYDFEPAKAYGLLT